MEAENVYSFPVLNEQTCTTLSAEIDSYRQLTHDSGIALPLSSIGLDIFFKDLVSHIHPILSSLYPQLSNYDTYPKLVSNRLFPTKTSLIQMTYEKLNNEDWPKHNDGDLATLNLCLSKDFEGTELRLFEKDKFVDYVHRIGRMIVVLGDNKHAVTSLKKGRRYSVIIKLNNKPKI